MKATKLYAIYFSPTDTSKQVALAFAQGFANDKCAIEEIDLTTDYAQTPLALRDAICVVAAPVYGGLIAPLALERINRLHGEGCIAMPIAVYGNRDYEDALLQLSLCLQDNGFSLLSGATFIGEHSFSRPAYPIAAGRPDAKDLQLAREWGMSSHDKLVRYLDCDTLPSLSVAGNFPLKAVGPKTPQAPVVSDDCILCGFCETVCPADAIRMGERISESDAGKCIKCCACVKKCPTGARSFDSPYTKVLNANCSARREPELFI